MTDYRSWLVARFPGGQTAQTLALAKGVATASSLRAAERTTGDFTRKPVAGFTGTGDFHLVINSSPTLGTGAGANKPWLMELPDPVSKIAWQSWVEMHPMACKKLGLQRGDLVFWRGHVAMVVNDTLLIHANGHTMSVAYEGIREAVGRISAGGGGLVQARQRIV